MRGLTMVQILRDLGAILHFICDFFCTLITVSIEVILYPASSL